MNPQPKIRIHNTDKAGFTAETAPPAGQGAFRNLAENLPDMIARFDRQMRCTFVNPAFEKQTGVLRDHVLGKIDGAPEIPEVLRRLWEPAVKQALREGREIDLEFVFPEDFGKRYFEGRVLPETDAKGQVEALMLIARDITERKQAEAHMSRISFHDTVTGLYNRAYFEEEVNRLDTERSLPISIIIGDVNHLKLTNDAFGHTQGDGLLRRIGLILRKCCRNEDVISRWGGDEFAVILPETDAAAASRICERIRKTAYQHGGGLPIRPSIALGTAVKQSPGENIHAAISLAEERMYDEKRDQGKKNRDQVIRSLLKEVNRKLPGHGTHLKRLRRLSRGYARVLELSRRDLSYLQMIILLHDIGKATIPDAYLTKCGPLTPGEWDTIKRHPDTGFRILRTFIRTAKISEEILALRERWDGTGYPRGLKGRQIPLLARIFSIIDTYDIMTHDRPYARVFTHKQALDTLRAEAGKQFDPALVQKFIHAVNFDVLS